MKNEFGRNTWGRKGVDFWGYWHKSEKDSKSLCEEVIDCWIRTKELPPIDRDDAAFFLIRRFDQASDFIQNLFLGSFSSIFAHPGYTTDEVLRWCLCEWWDEHGSRIAYCEDEARDEERFNEYQRNKSSS